MRLRITLVLIPSLLLVTTVTCFSQPQKPRAAGPTKVQVLTAEVVGTKLMPEKVFFRGQLTKVQSSNSGGVRYLDDSLVLAGLVENPGWAAGISDKYQGYLISEVTMVIGGQKLLPGSYGFGFVDGGKFIVMNLNSWELFTVSATSDSELKSPMPLQFLAEPDSEKFRLYREFKRVKLIRLVKSKD